MLVFTLGIQSFQSFLGGAKRISPIHSMSEFLHVSTTLANKDRPDAAQLYNWKPPDASVIPGFCSKSIHSERHRSNVDHMLIRLGHAPERRKSAKAPLGTSSGFPCVLVYLVGQKLEQRHYLVERNTAWVQEKRETAPDPISCLALAAVLQGLRQSSCKTGEREKGKF